MTAQDSTTKYDRYAKADVLATPQWLEEHLRDPALRVVEVDVSAAAYDAGHIDGAALWNVYSDLKDSSYQLVGKAAVENLLARSGISPDSTVVLYGYAPAMGLWLLKLYGHADVRILDCARGTWQDEERPLDQCRSQPRRHPIPPLRSGQADPSRPSEGGKCDRRPGMHHRGRAHRS